MEGNGGRRSYQTLEFWMTVVAMVVSIATYVTGSMVDNPDTSKLMQVLGTIGSLLAALGYGGLRTLQKGAEVKAEAMKAVGTRVAPKGPQ